MSAPCERCPCPGICRRIAAYCRWAAEEPPDSINLRNICVRSAICEPEPPPPPPPTPYPGLIRQAQNLASATVNVGWTAMQGGRVRVPDEEYARRLEVCRACPQYDQGRRRCRLCGCYTELKLRLATEQCPDDPPRWLRVETGTLE
jgi:hypothetical protein